MRIDRILFPTDFSECAERAFTHASHFAARYDAELHVLNVSVAQMRSENDPMSFIPLEPETPLVRSDAALQSASGAKVTHSQMTASSPVEGILNYADSHDASLIVMGTHGRTGIDHLLAGSVAEDVVRHAYCPVLTVRCRDGVGWKDQVRRILVPVDFSDDSPIALALELARAYGAELDLLHVVEEAVLPTIYGVEPLSPGAPLYLERTEGALKKLLEEHDIADLTVRTSVRVGHPARVILEFAQEDRSDLIVIASHGRTGLGRLLMGSVAEKVVRLADVPVFTYKRADRKRDAPIRNSRSANGRVPAKDDSIADVDLST